MYKIFVCCILIFPDLLKPDLQQIQQIIFYLPEKIEIWYNDNWENSNAEGNWKLCNVYNSPDSNAKNIGEFWIKYEKKIANFIIYYKSGSRDIIWDNDIGDWGYGIREFIIDTHNGYVKLPGKIFQSDAWVKLQKDDGLNAEVESVIGKLFYFPGNNALDITENKLKPLDNAVYFILSKDEDSFIVRKEIPSDMPCGEDIVETIDKDKLKKYKIKFEDLFNNEGEVIISLAYPKGC